MMRPQGLQRVRAARTIVARKSVEWRGALSRWASVQHNPFWAQSTRAESRAATPLKALLWIWLVGAFLTFCTADWWTRLEFSPARFERGGVGFVALLWLDVFALGAWFFALNRNAALLRVELIKARLLPVRLTPQTPEERVWLLSAPVTLWSAILLAPAAPVLLVLRMQGIVSALDLVGLSALAVMFLFSIPNWNPGAWQAQLERRAGTNTGDGFWKPAHLVFPSAYWPVGLLLLAIITFLEPMIVVRIFRSWLAGWNPEILRPLEVPVLGWPLFVARWLVTPQPFFGIALSPLVLVFPMWMAVRRRRLGRLAATLEPERFFWTTERQNRWRRDELAMISCGLLAIFGFFWPGAARDFWPSRWFLSATETGGETVAAWFIWCALGAMWALTALGNSALNAKPCPYGSPAFWRELQRRAGKIGAATLLVWLGAPLACGLWPFSPELWRVLIPTLAVSGIWIGVVGAFLLRETPVAPAAKNKTVASEVADDASENRPFRQQFLELWTFPANATTKRSTRASQFAGWLLALWFLNPPLLGYLFERNLLAFLVDKWHLFSPLTLGLSLRDLDIQTRPSFWLAVAIHTFLTIPLVLRAKRNIRLAQSFAPPKTRKPRQKKTSNDAPGWMEFDWAGFGGARKPGVSVRSQMPRSARAGAASTGLSRAPLRAPERENKALLERLKRFNNPLLLLETRRLMGQNVWPTEWRGWALASGFLALVLNALLLGANALNGFRFGTLWHENLGELNEWSFGVLFSIALVVGFAAPSVLTSAYDRDRLDGSLEMVFLTPLDEAEIASAKLAPVLIRILPLQAWQLPTLSLLALLAALKSQFAPALWLLPLALLMGTFTVRNAALFHVFGACARKTGAGGNLTLLALPFWLAEGSALAWAVDEGIGAVVWVALAMSGMLLVEAWFFWRASLWALRRQRRSERRIVAR